MAKLDNPRHEMFCHFIARGNLPVIAYAVAGYQRNKEAAEALLKLPRIRARIEELQPLYHKEFWSRVSPQTIIRERRENAEAREPEA